MPRRFSEAFTPTPGAPAVAHDLLTLDFSSPLQQHLPSDLAAVQYLLHDRRLLREPSTAPISTHARVHAAGLYVTRIADRFQTEMEIGGAGLDRYGFAMANAGSMLVQQGGRSETGSGSAGVALRGHPGTRLLSSDGNIRTSLWIEADALEGALSAMLDDTLRCPPAFRMAVDWSAGLATSLSGQIGLFAAELGRPDGLASNAVALASFKDLITRTVLLGLPHSHSAGLTLRPGAPAPAFLHRAEGFMRAHAGQPLRMQDVAVAAGCSVRTLNDVYRRFRGTTPLAALHAIRLHCLRDALLSGEDAPVATLARRYGFTNAARLAKAYGGRFGERPSETARRRGGRSGGA